MNRIRDADGAPGTAGASSTGTSIRLVVWYYLGTLLFILLDALGGWNVRVTGLQGLPALKYTYYAGCLGAGWLVHRFPRSAPFVALSESTINLAILLVGFLGTYLRALDAAMAGVPGTVMITYGQIINLLLNGGILVTGIYATIYLRSQIGLSGGTSTFTTPSGRERTPPPLDHE